MSRCFNCGDFRTSGLLQALRLGVLHFQKRLSFKSLHAEKKKKKKNLLRILIWYVEEFIASITEFNILCKILAIKSPENRIEFQN